MAPAEMDGVDFLRKHLMETDGAERLAELILAMAQKLTGAEVDALYGAGCHERAPVRANTRVKRQ